MTDTFRVRRTLTGPLLGLAALALAGLAAAPAAHAAVYVAGSGGEFGTIDPITGAFNSIATFGFGSGSVRGLGFVNGTLYGLVTNDLANTGGTDVYAINTTTGAEKLVGDITNFASNAFGGAGGATSSGSTFYLLSNGSDTADSNSSFATVNLASLSPNSATPTDLAATFVNPDTGITSDGLVVIQGPSLYTAAYGHNNPNFTDDLYSIDPASGTPARIGDTGTAESFSLQSGVVDGGTVYGFGGPDYLSSGADNGALSIYTLDTTTGAATQGASYESSLGGDSVTAAAEGPADVSAAPEPSQAGMLALMGLGPRRPAPARPPAEARLTAPGSRTSHGPPPHSGGRAAAVTMRGSSGTPCIPASFMLHCGRGAILTLRRADLPHLARNNPCPPALFPPSPPSPRWD